MARYFFLALLVCLCSNALQAQQHGLRGLVAQAQQSICQGDTSMAIESLRQAAAQYPDEAMILSVYKVLAELYTGSGQMDQARQALMAGLRLRPHQGTAMPDTLYCPAAPYINYSYRSRADLCAGLSDLYKREGKEDSCYYYLIMADNLIASYGDCGNAIEAYRGELSIRMADHFTSVGDTVAAINCLLDNFLKPDVRGPAITQKLADLLLTRYSALQIKEHIDRASNNIRIEKKGNGKYVLSMTLFDHRIEQWGSGRSGQHRKHIRNHPSLIRLKNNAGTF